VKKGEILTGHFCYDCLVVVEKTGGKANAEKTDWCLRCLHRSAGKDGRAIVGNWLELRKPPDTDTVGGQ